MEKAGRDSETPALLIAPKILHDFPKSILNLFHFLKHVFVAATSYVLHILVNFGGK